MINIIKGWLRFLFSKRTQMASDRIKICLDCPFRKGYFCGVCFCELHAKASVEEEECPKDKWPKKPDHSKGILFIVQ